MPKEYLMAEAVWPSNIVKALSWISIFGDDAAADFFRRFEQHWGSLDEGALIRAIHEGAGDEKLFALYALGKMQTSVARETLMPFLSSVIAQERWASALCLGRMDPEATRPALSRMLTEFLPISLSAYSPGGAVDFEYWRIAVPMLIGSLGDVHYVPALRSALEVFVGLLNQGELAGNSDVEEISENISDWLDVNDDNGRLSDWGFADEFINCQDEIIYALGRLGAFGSLTSIRAKKSELYLWMVHLTIGHLHGRYSWKDALNQDPQSPLAQEVRATLQATFGLSGEEVGKAYELYMQAKSGSLAVKWQHIENTDELD